jgi:ribosomal protein L15E
MPDLDGHTGLVLVQGRWRGEIVTLQIVQPLRHQQRRRLRQVGVQQLVEFVPGVDPGGYRHPQPHHAQQTQHRGQQPRLQGQAGFRSGRGGRAHAFGTLSRRST